jgi:hypothetical protein
MNLEVDPATGTFGYTPVIIGALAGSDGHYYPYIAFVDKYGSFAAAGLNPKFNLHVMALQMQALQ